MVQYILECIAFQLVFLIIYDLFLKRETFFQWNRLYLITTYIVSMILPWIKIEAMRTTVPDTFQAYPEFLWNLNDAAVKATTVEETSFNISREYAFLFGGMFLASLVFGYKLYQIFALRRKGEVHYFIDFTRIIVSNSSIAFSFFKSIFLGDKVIAKEHQSIVQHELVHIRQRHSYDLMFFEIMRIVGWFNPLVYVYQNRVSELHEFIADAQVAKTHKKEQYQLLLSEVFQTEHISFINQFFKKSLIKKRIVMLTKEKSKQVLKLKYLLLVPLVFGMLAYTSAESKSSKEEATIEVQTPEDLLMISKIEDEIEKEIEKEGTLQKVYFSFVKQFRPYDDKILTKEEYFKRNLLQQRYFETIKVEFGDDVQPRPTFQMPLPSTARYENYVNRIKAFRILDKNLKVSVAAYDQSIMLIGKKQRYTDSTFVYKVGDVKDFTGKELLNFNTKMAEIFENDGSSYSKIVLTDNKYAFEIDNQEKNSDLSQHLRELNFPSKKVSASGSVVRDSEPVPFATVDEVPVFPDCENDDDKRGCFYENMREHIRKNFRYPKEAQKQGQQGRVAVIFTMNTKGGLSNVKVRGPHKLLEDEAVRIISRLPKFKPGVHEGKEVNVIFSIPITFKMQNDESEFGLLKEDGTNDRAIQQYNQLVTERKRLLVSSDEKNPIIVNLDQQLRGLKKSIFSASNSVPFALVDEAPIFPSCDEDENKRDCFNKMMQKHISKNFNYPKQAQEKGIQGRVNILFTIGKDGTIQNVRMRGPDPLLEKEAARIIGLLPKMTPGKHKGKAVNVPFSIPITFKLQGKGWEPDLKKLSNMIENIPIFYINGEIATKEEVMALNQDEIESMFALKGEAAIQKYGQKAHNGVLEITTKQKD